MFPSPPLDVFLALADFWPLTVHTFLQFFSCLFQTRLKLPVPSLCWQQEFRFFSSVVSALSKGTIHSQIVTMMGLTGGFLTVLLGPIWAPNLW